MDRETKAAYELLRDIGELTGEIKALRAENARLVAQNASLIAALTKPAEANWIADMKPPFEPASSNAKD